jgi:opacity protein-like surface antigen
MRARTVPVITSIPAILRVATIAGLATVALTPPQAAGADTVFGANLGYFAVKSFDSRVTDDVLSENLDFLAFDMTDFNGAMFGGEFMFGLGNFAEAGVGAGFYQRTVPSIYADFTDVDRSEIEQDLKLRIMPVTFTARVFPAGRSASVQPYIGGGMAILAWRYSESGEFIDFNNGNRTFHDVFTDEGRETAPLVFGGVRFPVGTNLLVGGEFRWQGGDATLDPEKGFAGERIDLGGYTTMATFQVRF